MIFRRRRRDKQERSESQAPIPREDHAQSQSQSPSQSHPASGGAPAIRDVVAAHLTEHLGECDLVLHDVVSDLVHVDVAMWAPTRDRAYCTFATIGMSDEPMTVPPAALEAGYSDRAELLICLPAGWPVPLTGAETDVEAVWGGPDGALAYLPIRWLKILARLPHEFGSWLGLGHTIPNGDPPEPFADGSQVCAWVLLPPQALPPAAWKLKVADGAGRVDFFGVVAVTEAELDLKLAKGVAALYGGFERNNVSELLDLARASTV